jgi:hypothetical protein
VAAFLGDLLVFSLARTTWTDLGALVFASISQKIAAGIPVDFSEFGPAPRYGHGLLSAGGSLFVFGGYGYVGPNIGKFSLPTFQQNCT